MEFPVNLYANGLFYSNFVFQTVQLYTVSDTSAGLIVRKSCMIVSYDNQIKVRYYIESSKKIYVLLGGLPQFWFLDSVTLYRGIYVTSK